jgi:hypothetical protein
MSSPIQVDSAHQVILIEQEEHLVGELAELEKTSLIHHEVGRTLWHTTGEGGVSVPPFLDRLVFLRCPRLHLGLLRLLPYWLPRYSE